MSLSQQGRLPAAQRRKMIISKATVCFASANYHTTSMEDIADSVGVTKPVIYQHFASKRDLFSELIKETGRELCAQIRNATETATSPHQRVEKGYEAYYRFACESRAGYELLFGSSLRRDPEFRNIIEDIEEEVADLVMSKIDAEIDDNHRRFLALGIISLAEGTVRRWLATLDPEIHPPHHSVPYEETNAALWAKRVTQLAWFGLRGIT